jgi:hypothetical protein
MGGRISEVQENGRTKCGSNDLFLSKLLLNFEPSKKSQRFIEASAGGSTCHFSDEESP